MPINGRPTYYEFFGLENFESDMVKVKGAYRSMALKWHPDRNENKVDAERMMKQVNEIWNVLNTKKDSYDRYLRNKINPLSEDFSWANVPNSQMTEEAIRRAYEEILGKDYQKNTKIRDIKEILDQLDLRQLQEVENYANFIKGG